MAWFRRLKPFTAGFAVSIFTSSFASTFSSVDSIVTGSSTFSGSTLVFVGAGKKGSVKGLACGAPSSESSDGVQRFLTSKLRIIQFGIELYNINFLSLHFCQMFGYLTRNLMDLIEKFQLYLRLKAQFFSS